MAKTNKALEALIGNAPAFLGSGFFVPARNNELLRWLLDAGLKIGWPANLMTIGQYNDPASPFLPSIAF